MPALSESIISTGVSSLDASHMRKKSPSVADFRLMPRGSFGTPDSSESPSSSSTHSVKEVKKPHPAQRRYKNLKRKPAAESKIKRANVNKNKKLE
jgi:hypothetical protein